MILDFFKIKAAMAADINSLLEATRGGAGFATATETTVSGYLGSIVQYILSFLGVLFVVFIIYAGFLWMTARGDDEQVSKAKDIMRNSVVGLIIVLSAALITTTIFKIFFTPTAGPAF